MYQQAQERSSDSPIAMLIADRTVIRVCEATVIACLCMSSYSFNAPIVAELYVFEKATTFYLELGLHSNVVVEGALVMIKEIHKEEEYSSRYGQVLEVYII